MNRVSNIPLAVGLFILCHRTICEPSCKSTEDTGLSLLQSGTAVNKLPNFHEHGAYTHKVKKHPHHVQHPQHPQVVLKEESSFEHPKKRTHVEHTKKLNVAQTDLQDGQLSSLGLALDEGPGMEQAVKEEVEQFLKNHVATSVREEIGGSMRDALKDVVREKVGAPGSMKKMVAEAVKASMERPGTEIMKDKVQFMLKAKVREALKTVVADQVRDNARDVLENVTKSMVGEKFKDVLKEAVSQRVKETLSQNSDVDIELESKLTDRLGSKLETKVEEKVKKKMGKVLKETIQAQLVDVVGTALKEEVTQVVKDTLDKQEVLDEMKEQALAGAGLGEAKKEEE